MEREAAEQHDETGGLAPHEWAELDDNQRARVVELVVVEEWPLVETLRLASDETKEGDGSRDGLSSGPPPA